LQDEAAVANVPAIKITGKIFIFDFLIFKKCPARGAGLLTEHSTNPGLP